MFNKISISILFCFFILKSVKSQQTSFDETDTAVNHLRQYIIRFDVANGNIYVPIKKKIQSGRKESEYFKAIPFVYMKDSIIRKHLKSVTTKTNYENGVIKNYTYDSVYDYEVAKYSDGEKKYLSAGKFFKPKVGSFIRLIFENVPKGMDVKVVAEFMDKNLENASTFESFLNKYSSSLDTAVTKDAIGFAKVIEQKKEEIKQSSDSTKKAFEQKLQSDKDVIGNNLKSFTGLLTKLNGVTVQGKNNQPITVDLGRAIDILGEAKDILKKLPDTLTLKADSTTKFISANFIKEYIQKAINTVDKEAKAVLTNDDRFTALMTKYDLFKNQLDSLVTETKKNYETLLTLRETDLQLNDSLSKALAYLLDSINFRRTIYIQPIQVANNDITLLKITYRKDDKAQNDINREILLKNKYGFKLDFSTGFIGTGLKDDNYRLVPTPGTIKDTTTIKDDPKGKFAIGFAILAHAYFRTGERVNVALNSGLMLNGSNQTINYLAGLSLPLGLEQRFVISGGLTFGKVKRLTTGYETEKAYPASVLNLSSGVPYTEQWQRSWYIGFSYNISSLTASAHKVVIAK